jgi:hypothetical protein
MSPQNSTEVAEMCQCPYISIVGSLIYLALTTRPDITYAAEVPARFNSNPGLPHWQAVKHVLHYLKGTLDHKLTYRPSDASKPFITYSDANYGGNVNNGRSTGGYVVKIGTGAVLWSLKLTCSNEVQCEAHQKCILVYCYCTTVRGELSDIPARSAGPYIHVGQV